MAARIARSLVGNVVAAVGLSCLVTSAAAQDAHDHTSPMSGVHAPAAVSMNYGTAGGDTERRDPIAVVGAPADAAPCHDTRPGIEG